MRVEPLTVEHARALVVQPHQAEEAARLHDPRYVAEVGPAFAALDGERVLAIGGVADNGLGRAIAWCWLAAGLGARLIPVTWAARCFLRECRIPRIEIVTHAEYEPGERWATALGFQFEAPLRAYFAPKPGEKRRRDGLLWARVRYE